MFSAGEVAAADDTSRKLSFDSTAIDGELVRPEAKFFLDRKGRLDPCISTYVGGKITLEEMERCLLVKAPPDQELPEGSKKVEEIFKLVREIEKGQRARDELKKDTTGWGRFSLLMGAVWRSAQLDYPGIYRKHNRTYPENPVRRADGSVLNDGMVTTGRSGQLGTRIALTSEPGYGILEGATLFQPTVLDISIYGSNEEIPSISLTYSALKAEWLVPIQQRSFLQFGMGAVSDVIAYMGGLDVGIAAQIQGTPIGTPDRKLDILGVSSTLQSFTMLQAGLEMGLSYPSPWFDKEEVFCNQIPLHKVPGLYPQVHCGGDELPEGLSPKGPSFNLKPSFGIFGEQAFRLGLVNYSANVSYYPLRSRLEFNGGLYAEYNLTPAVRLYADVRGSRLQTVGKDEGPDAEVIWPSTAFELRAQAGLRLVFSRL